jgi:hypothetical protein
VTLGALILASAWLGPRPALAWQEEPSRISDNSFLLEEAYNQEPKVVQHIFTFSRPRGGGGWLATMTDEWPLKGQTHQLSYTGVLLRTDGPGGGTGLGDLAINYRWNAIRGEGRLWMAPRFTVLLPTGSARMGRGSGGLGLEAAIPVSITLGPRFTTHLNAALTVNPGARGRGNPGVAARSARLGASLVGDVSRRVNLLVETVYESSRDVLSVERTTGGQRWVVSPGIRWAHDLASGLQIVPGLAYTVDVGPGEEPDALFLYLSFEYPFGKRH